MLYYDKIKKSISILNIAYTILLAKPKTALPVAPPASSAEAIGIASGPAIATTGAEAIAISDALRPRRAVVWAIFFNPRRFICTFFNPIRIILYLPIISIALFIIHESKN
jgi:hypothetical protein